MVKFSKELEAQLIPEWREAFVNYWQLKKYIKKIKLSRKAKQPQDCKTNVDFGFSIFDPIRCLATKVSDKLFDSSTTTEMIKVKSKLMEDGEEEIYETELAQLFSEEDEVNQFYITNESEFLGRGEILNKQLQILVDLKQILNDRRWKNSPGKTMNSGSVPSSWSSSPRSSDYSESGGELSENSTETASQTEEAIAALERNGVNFVNTATRGKTKKGKPRMAVRIDIPATNPMGTISAVTSMLWEDLVNNPKKEGHGEFINRKKIQCAEKMIRGAFVELYRGLGLIKTYSSLNMVAFTKILKKFDKVSNQQASASYLGAVKRSYFISSDKVVRLMDEVESIFTKHFANNDRKKAMKFLRPQQHKDSHMVTFFVGLFTGSFVSLFSVYAILAHLSGIFHPALKVLTWKLSTLFSVPRCLPGLHNLHDCCGWGNGSPPYTASQRLFPSQVDAIPGFIVLIRVFSNVVIFELHFSGFDGGFFMADQLTSQIPLLRHMESTACYFLAGNLRTHKFEACSSGRLFRELAYVISFLPYYWRAMQCARRWFDECDPTHLANMGKYVSAMVAAGASSYSLSIILGFCQGLGLLKPKSINLWLRDDLVLKNKGIYYCSIALNVVLRVAWVETVIRFRRGAVESRLIDFLLASLEVIRRGHWNFYRLENEHLNNGKVQGSEDSSFTIQRDRF
ncbi:hypothetical protein FNV43_RR01135 [Rhamnella rubrinervis]|uniref:Phosphate transporter PHO1 n=1 Tax=Rhamnella rubrinervis TaxID=2594499 RepID=A0A8K0MT21_9ROSA|nr:hypothetical protein FNV43_RR01135 [Rhamnella rubrinervis]